MIRACAVFAELESSEMRGLYSIKSKKHKHIER